MFRSERQFHRGDVTDAEPERSNVPLRSTVDISDERPFVRVDCLHQDFRIDWQDGGLPLGRAGDVRPDQQKEYVRDGWNFPGDIFTKDEDGYFHYCCRSDDMIICGGINISGPEVESVLIEHPAVKEVAVVASPDELKRFVPKAFVVLTEGYIAGDELILELQDFVKNEVAPYKYPRKVEFVDRLPRVESGKIRRVVLRKRELKRSQASI